MELTTLERAEHENRTGDERISTKSVRHSEVLEEAWYDWPAQLAHVRYTRPGRPRECRTRMYSRPQLHAALQAAGFIGIRMTGDFSGSPVHPANRTVIIATTPPEGHLE